MGRVFMSESGAPNETLTFTVGSNVVYDGTAAKTVTIPKATTVVPKALAVSASIGQDSGFAKGDHVHPLPAVATEAANGLMSSGDKQNLDNAVTDISQLQTDTKLSYVDITLTAKNWTGTQAPFTQSVSNKAINEQDIWLIRCIDESASVATVKAYNKAYGIITGGTASTHLGNISFKVLKKPATDITVRLLMRGTDADGAVPDPENVELDASDLQVRDTHGLIAGEAQDTNLQAFLDEMADRVENTRNENGTTSTDLTSHITNKNNPHGVTAAQLKVYTQTETDAALAKKQNTLTFDTAPKASSSNPVTSGGINTALANKADKTDAFLPRGNVTDLNTATSPGQYSVAKAATNSPFSDSICYVDVTKPATSSCVQVAYKALEKVEYIAVRYASGLGTVETWYPWRYINLATSVSAATLDNKLDKTATAATAQTATKLASARNLLVSLASTLQQAFDGTKDVLNIGVTGILPKTHGGTGNANGQAASVAHALKFTGGCEVSYDGSSEQTVTIPAVTDAVTGATEAITQLRKDLTLSYVDITLKKADWIGTDAPFTQSVNSKAINGQDMWLMRYPNLTASVAIAEAYNKAYDCIAEGVAATYLGSAYFKVWKKPTIDVKVRLMMRGTNPGAATTDPANVPADGSKVQVTDTFNIVAASVAE